MRLSDLKTQKKSPKTAPAPRAPATEKPAASTTPPSEALTAQAPPRDNLFGKEGAHTAPEAPKASAFRLSTLVKKKPQTVPAPVSTAPPPEPPPAREPTPDSAHLPSLTQAGLPPGVPTLREVGTKGRTEAQQSNLRLTGLFGKKPEASSAEIPAETPPPDAGGAPPEAARPSLPAGGGGATGDQVSYLVAAPHRGAFLERRPSSDGYSSRETASLPAGGGATGDEGPARESVLESSSEAPEEDVAAAAAEQPLPEEIPSRFTEHPAGIYEAAKQLGIVLPVNKEAFIENKTACLTMIFQKCLSPALEKEIIWPMIKSMVSDISNLLAVNGSILHLFRRQQAKSADQLVWHSFYTAVMALDLAGQVANLDCSIEDIGGAALIHDIGLIGLPPGSATSIIEGPHLDEEHIQRGVELARRIGVPGEVLTMISHHCGRLDGSGYPPGLSARTFPRSSQIVAIADLFERTMIGMVKPKKKPAGEFTEFNIAQVFRKYRKGFDNELLKKMIDVIGFYPVGSFVELSNHALCRVIEQNRDFPLHPVVQVVIDGAGVHPDTEKLIDLKQVQLLSIIRQVDMPIDTAEPAS